MINAGAKAPIISLLYVDDEPDLLELTKLYLENSGDFIVTTALSASEAIRLCSQQPYDTIVSDYRMPEMDGIEFLKHIRAKGDTMPFIIFTGKGREEVVIEAFNNGADFYLQKGGDPKAQFAELSNKIHYAVSRRQTEKALRESEAKFRQVFSGMPSGVAIYEAVDDGEDFVFRDFNAASEAIEHVQKEEIIGRRVTEVFPGVKEFGIFSVFQRVWRTGKPEFFPSAVYRDARDPGTWRENWVYRLPSGEIVANYNDITDRKEAEEALRIQHNLALALTTCHTLKEALEHILDAALHAYGLDSGGVYVVDPVTGALDLVVHRGLSPEFVEYTSHFDAVTPQVQRAKTGTPFFGRYADIRQSGKDEIRDREGVTALASIPVLHEGNLVAILNMASHVHDDISIHTRQLLETLAAQISGALVYIRSKEALQESEERFHTLFQKSPLPYQSLDADGRFLTVNDAWLETMGYNRDEVIGHWFGDFIAPEFSEIFRVNFPKFKATGEIQVEFKMKRKDSSLITVAFDGKIGHYPNGSFRQTHCVFRDITERKRAEDALAIANRKLNLLSSITRHDIRNQLMALNAYIALSKEVVDKPAELRDLFAKEQKIADAIIRQINFTKDYEELGVKSAVWQDVSVLIRNSAVVLPMGKIRLDIGCPGLEVFADPLLGKVFYNLIENSLHYGGDVMTAIRITAGEQGEELQIIYEDNGVGISADDRTQLFTKGFGKKTGLGLFLSREILSISGITITETGEPGKGARFEITVPSGGYRFRN